MRILSAADDAIMPTNGILLPLNTPSERTTVLPIPSNTLLAEFMRAHQDLEAFKGGKPVKVDGQTLSITSVTAAARYNARVELDHSPSIKERVYKSRDIVENKVHSGASVYGLSTGFGGSADTRTDKPALLGHALLQHQHAGVLPSSTRPLDVLPLQDPLSLAMPESWVRGAILVRMNSLIRGHSGVRWELVEKMNELLTKNITPLVPLRGSISASGDLSPLSYIAGTLIANPSIRVFHGPTTFGPRQISPSSDALQQYGVAPLPLVSKEHLGITNGTAFSAAVASLALNDAVHLVLLAQVCIAMGTEALAGTRASYHPFIHATARPHPGQVECAQNVFSLLEGSKFARLHEEETTIEDDKYLLRQDRYPLRTSPQFLGPQIEDIFHAYYAVTQECNSTTDNPLIDGETGEIHHGGNFQAMAVTNAMEKTRLALHHIGKLIFSQSTELVNPAMNNGLPPSLAATDPSLDYHGKGIDIATAAYVAELGHLANPVSTHIQSAEMHNQAVNSLALISARATMSSLQVLSNLFASYIYLLCQALDIRALQWEFARGLQTIVDDELSSTFGFLSSGQLATLSRKILKTMNITLDKTSTMDAVDRMNAVAASTTTIFIDFFADSEFKPSPTVPTIELISQFRSQVASLAAKLLHQLRGEFLNGGRGKAPASPYLNKTKPIYEFVRLSLGVRMQGSENYSGFVNGIGVDEVSIGQNISLIYEAIRDGRIQPVVVSLFR